MAGITLSSLDYFFLIKWILILLKYYFEVTLMKTKFTFNRKPKHQSKALYSFNRYLNVFEKSNYQLFVQSYYLLKSSHRKYWRDNPI